MSVDARTAQVCQDDMMIRRTRRIALLTGSLGIFAGCGGGGTAAGPDKKPDVPACEARVASIAIAGADNIVVRKSSDFTAQPRDAAGNVIAATVRWSSSDSITAVVSTTGTVTGTAAGTVSIVVSAGCTGSASRQVTINPSALPIRGLFVHPGGSQQAVFFKGRGHQLQSDRQSRGRESRRN